MFGNFQGYVYREAFRRVLRIFVLAVALLGVMGLLGQKAQTKSSDLTPLVSAADQELGPLALPSLYHEVLGVASVYGAAKPDLFVATAEKTDNTLLLFRWLRDSPEGVPIFAPPRRIVESRTTRGTILQTPDGTIHGLWLEGRQLVHATFDRRRYSFVEKATLPMQALPHSPLRVAAIPHPDGSLDVALEFREKPPMAFSGETNRSSVHWRPYDAAGISTVPVPYGYLMGLRLPGILQEPSGPIRKISPRRRDASFRMEQITTVNFGSSRPPGFIAGTRMGNFHYYPDPFGDQGPERLLATDLSGNALRHPSISPSVAAYPNSSGQSDLIAAGEGGFYFYRFTGHFTAQGAPKFEAPVPILQEQSYLFAGKLPTPSVIDWDGDEVLDIIAGNSEGFVLFFKNIGTNDSPAFLPGERLQAGGRDIHIQAGYSGSVQGLPEARWGYASPTVVDWNEDGLPDLIMGDITGDYTVYLNHGSRTKPLLAPAHPIYCDGINLHGMWRSRAAVASLDGRMAILIIDGDDHFHLYWKIDDYNVEDGGKVRLADGSPILTSHDPAGGTGRCKLDFYDYDGDGILDLIIGTGRRSAIPNKQSGYPLPTLGHKTLGTPLFMKNIGSNAQPVFAPPLPFHHQFAGLVQPGGSHETGAIATSLGGDGPNLLVASETGYLYLLSGRHLSLMEKQEAIRYRNRPNSLPPP